MEHDCSPLGTVSFVLGLAVAVLMALCEVIAVNLSSVASLGEESVPKLKLLDS